MPSITGAIFLFHVTVISSLLSDIHASKIHSLEVPPVVRNGTGPIDLSCIYNVRKDENGLVIKWYHNMDQVYQWIPPMPPQDVGVLNGFTEYPESNLRHPNSKSIIHIKMVSIEMGGEYACTISTFQEEDSATMNMIVYAPETDVKIYVSYFNESHLNLTCVEYEAQPRPILKFYIEGIEVDNYYDEIVKMEEGVLSVSRSTILNNILEPILIDCEISIPRTDYKRRKRIVYYPVQSLAQTSNASGDEVRPVNTNIVIIILYILILSK
ncbi:uncharacterized protein LOC117601263 [Osmia lignaria lignaria]|uniref:uncharacterized protein LOC117601263 n=1 Tax=Osmia lignaria lignaria TaxID=1437193 RepID=UPI0014788F46|nr:uncharacterized protein LOC117601263 isoform X2 [Osmia lignaria]